MDFLTLPEEGNWTLHNVGIPEFLPDGHLNFCLGSISVRNGIISSEDTPTRIDGQEGIIFPLFVDMHTHLDKGHIWPRSPNPDGTFGGALQAVGAGSK